MTVEFVLSETHFLGGHRARRALSLTGEVRTTVQHALGNLVIWDFYVHQEHVSDVLTLWKITLVMPQTELHQYQRKLADPVFLPQINDHWPHSGDSLFEVSSSTVKGLTVRTAPPSPPDPPGQPPSPPSPPPEPSPPPPPFSPNAQLLSRGEFALKETYFAGSHVVEDPEAAQETGEISAILRAVLTSNGVSVHDLEMVSIGIEGTTNQLAVTWSVVLTAPASSDWANLGEYVESFGFTTALTSAATTAGSTQHTSSFFEAVGDLAVESIGMGNVPSPPPAVSVP